MMQFLAFMDAALKPLCFAVIFIVLITFLIGYLRWRRRTYFTEIDRQQRAQSALRKSYKHDDQLRVRK